MQLENSRSAKHPLLLLLFFLSGFCGLVYQVVWARLAFASFGIITPVLSVVISVFMLGLSLGSWAGGRLIGPLVERARFSAVHWYAMSEVVIGLGAFVVPKLFGLGQTWLSPAGQRDSLSYLFFSALVLSLVIFPWCFFMGTTFPFMMRHVQERGADSADSFSFLYLANVLGAMAGAIVTAFCLVEFFGFHDTLKLAAALNFLVAVIAVGLGGMRAEPSSEREAEAAPGSKVRSAAVPNPMTRWILFTTGFVSMAMEVVWTRAFTSVLTTHVYAFALIVATYLGATFLGSWVYRRDLRRGQVRPVAELLSLLCVAAFLPILFSDYRLVRAGYFPTFPNARCALLVLVGICPFCGLLGYLTPSLIDEYSAGAPKEAGLAYALNVLGCILGPLFACYVLLPSLNERYALILLGLPFLWFFYRYRRTLSERPRWLLGAAAAAVLACSVLVARNFEDYVLLRGQPAVALHDYAATVIASGRGMDRKLIVGGVNMTVLTPITKFMAHLPLAYHQGRPQSALIICFGMGTTYRSALSWDVETTAVELVPSVKDTFGFFFPDAGQQLSNPKGQVIIDDGRRYLSRTRGAFDAIVLDPPPPISAAGVSLLYSKDFYTLAKERLRPGGILQTWFAERDTQVRRAALKAITESFPYVRCFESMEGYGLHVLASMEPIESCSAEELVRRMPAKAKADLSEWNPGMALPDYVSLVLRRELPVTRLVNLELEVPLTDDLPYNEYYLMRVLGWL